MRYTNLKEPKEFRLVRLKPRNYKHGTLTENVAVFCTLEHSFRGDTPYVALSYAWGDEDDRRLIWMNDDLVPIGTNLEEALRELRDSYEDVVIWVDKLCINQEDESEKSQQVQQMRGVYAEASRVIAWIGPAAEGSELIFYQLKQMAKNVAAEKYHQIFEDHQVDEALPSILRSFQRFCQRTYWSRLWIMQEFAVGWEVQIACGSMTISGQELFLAIRFIQNLGNFVSIPDMGNAANELVTKSISRLVSTYTCPEFSFVQSVLTRRQRYQIEGFKTENYFLRVLITSLVLAIDYNHPNCSNPRDRIFSLLGLANDSSFFDDILDYGRSCEDIYEATARKFLDQGHIDILSYCQFPKPPDVATWVPDWRQPTRRPCANSSWFSHFSASGDSLALQQVSHTGPRTVTLRGTFVDTIKAIGSPWDPDWLTSLQPGHTKKYLKEILAFCQESPRVRDHEEDLDTAQIAIAGRMNCTEAESRQGCLMSYRQLLQEFSATERQHDSTLSPQAVGFGESIYARYIRLLHSRRPFISLTGFVGLAPKHVNPGDVICIFLGSRTPYMIRCREDGHYGLVGETYVHGIMYGEHMTENPDIETIKLT